MTRRASSRIWNRKEAGDEEVAEEAQSRSKGVVGSGKFTPELEVQGSLISLLPQFSPNSNMHFPAGRGVGVGFLEFEGAELDVQGPTLR